MPTVDMAFRLLGKSIPADNGYPLYGALCRHLPALHRPTEDGPATPQEGGAAHVREGCSLWEAVGVHPVNGHLSGGRRLVLTGKSRLTIRVDSSRIPELLPLAGKRLSVGEDTVRVGVPQVHALHPVARVRSRLVVIRGFLDPEPFLEAVRRQLDAIGVGGTLELIRRMGARSLEGGCSSAEKSPFVKRTIRIKDKEVVGYAVDVQGLTAKESIRLQEVGVGGRRRFGCGVFVPARASE